MVRAVAAALVAVLVGAVPAGAGAPGPRLLSPGGTPVESTAPAAGGISAASAASAAGGTPAQRAAPAAGGTPAQIAAPAAGGTPAQSAAPAAGGTPAQRAAPARSPQRALLDRYCVTCHNQRLQTGGLALDVADVSRVGDAPDLWERVVLKLRGGMMPPAGRPRPDGPALGALRGWLEAELDRTAAATVEPGRVPTHRLNRAEYANAVRDLLALEIDAEALLPADDTGHGFDNLAGTLALSPALMERYLSAARRISRLAVGDPAIGPGLTSRTYTVPIAMTQNDRMSEALPFGSRGRLAVRHRFPLDGEYVFTVRLKRSVYEYIVNLDEAHDLDVRIDGRRVARFTVGGAAPGKPAPVSFSGTFVAAGASAYPTQDWDDYRTGADADLVVRVPVRAGARVVGVAFADRSWEHEGVLQPDLREYGATVTETTDTSTRPEGPGLESVTVDGPYAATGPGETASRSRIFVCRPDGADAGGEACARSILARLARRAYRRPVGAADLDPLLAFYREGRTTHREGSAADPAQGREAAGFEAGIQSAIERLLIDPEFLFRIERDPAGVAPGAPYRLTDLELASRLSFFLWSSIPDDELLDLAARRRLSDRGVLQGQVRRMLADARASALVDNFAGQWLSLRSVEGIAPDPNLFPGFDENLREALRRETELFFESQLREDRSVVELLSADYTFLNERLARHYGIRGIAGSRYRRVTLADKGPAAARRLGLLGHGSILAVTSYGNRTSPVLRAKWLLENVLGTPPAPPPAGHPAPARGGRVGRAAHGARAALAAPGEPRLRRLPRADGPAGLRARELRRHRPVADERRRAARRRLGRPRRRAHHVRGPRRAAAGAARPLGPVRRDGGREAARLCPRSRRRVARPPGHSQHRAGRGGRRPPVVVARPGHRRERAVPDAEVGVMIITRKALPRRTVLRGVGAAVALPLLDGMVPAATALARTAARPVPRFGVVYIPNGVVLDEWTPADVGAGFAFSPILAPLEPFRDRVLVLSGLTQNVNGLTARSGAVHGRCATKFLTGAIPRPFGQEGNDFLADVSLDQLVAREIGGETPIGSLELSLESGDKGAGTCDGGYSCTYSHTISWRGPRTPLPMEHNPRVVFERMFGDGGSTDPAARRARAARRRSLLDSVRGKAADLRRGLGPSDAARLGEYLDAVRDIERRIQRAEAQSARELPAFDQPAGVPAGFADHARLMFDLQVLAWQSDLTRVITFMVGREFSSRTYPEIGAPGGHHPLSHEGSAASREQLVRINRHHAEQFAYYLDRLAATPDGDGTLLDHAVVYYGAGMAEGDHRPWNLPLVVAGGGGGRLAGGRHIRYAGATGGGRSVDGGTPSRICT